MDWSLCASGVAMIFTSSISMKKRNEASTMKSMQEELRALLTSADNLLRLFSNHAATGPAELAERFVPGGWTTLRKAAGEG
jgi:hypothetical protein